MSLPFSWTEWFSTDALPLAGRGRRRDATADQVAEQAAAAVDRTGLALSAVVELFADAVTDPQPTGADRSGLLYGVPLFMKDSWSGMTGRLRELGSPLAAGQICAQDCPLTSNLRAAGFNLIVRSSLPECVRHSTPYTRETASWSSPAIRGESPGGSAALVAACVVPVQPRAVTPPVQCAFQPLSPAWSGSSRPADCCHPKGGPTN